MKNAVITLFTIIALIQPGALLVRAHETNRMYDKINYGDANLDNVINISDATQIQKLIAKYNINSVLDIVDDKNLLDLDGNGTVNISDVTTLNRYYAKIIIANCKIGETAYIWLNEEYVKATEITSPDSPVMRHLYVSNDYLSDEADFGEYKFNTMFDANEFITGNNEKTAIQSTLPTEPTQICRNAMPGLMTAKELLPIIAVLSARIMFIMRAMFKTRVGVLLSGTEKPAFSKILYIITFQKNHPFT